MRSREVLATNIKYYRYKLNLSQEKFCNKFNYSRTYINEVENAKRSPSLEWLEQMADNLNISVCELLTFNKDHVVSKKRIDEK